MNRYRCAKVLVVVLPLLALTAAAATGLATAAWRTWGTAALLTWVGPRNVSGPAAQASTAPEAAPAPDAPALPVTLATAVVIEAAYSPPMQEPPRAEPDVVDYERLNRDVKLVAETLERFNQKLLRMIAQARAVQAQNEGSKAASGAGGPDQSSQPAEPAAVPGSAPQPKSGSGPSG